ncbi:TonB-dependent siderophore receptor [Sphingomonas cavernae]|uniref:TonB-dependent siderophore receptor n=1 Tax=Sphingomonas cavernae TaxID=2320861 RepID=A0A418WQT0_9SPHN|nr:TonB-dependent siderophore receptor [Sphingomonas cavernae]RJF93615.1 TonB-dependent siderophore receptor [Sphingomonas cavernae]
MVARVVGGLLATVAWTNVVQAQEVQHGDITVTAERAVTATKTDTPLIETPQAISVVTDQLFRDRGALNVQETLRYSAGVTGEAYGLDTRGDASMIRGLAPVQFLDGMRNLYTFAPFTRTAVDTLSRVEVLRGPSSVLYGQASNGGIINSVSKRPEFETSGTVRLEYGSWDRKQAAVDITGPLNSSETLAGRVVAVVRDANQQTRVIDDNRVLLQPSLSWRPGPDTQVTLIGLFQRDRSASSQQFLPLVSAILAPNDARRLSNRTFLGDEDYDTLQQRTASATLIADHRVSDLISISARARYIDAKSTFRELYPDVYSNPANPFIDGTADTGRTLNRYAYQTKPHGKILTSDVNTRFEFDTGPFSHQLLAGIDYSNYFERTLSASGGSAFTPGITPIDAYDPDNTGVPANVLPYALLPEQRNTQLGLYVQDQIRYADRVTLVAGVRHDRARSKTEGVDAVIDKAWTFKVGLIGELGYGLSPYLSYSEAFQPVSGINPRTGNAYVPTRGRQYEGGVKWQPQRGVLITANYYDIVEENRPTNDPADPINVFQTGEVTSKGFEIEGAFALPGDIQLTAAYSHNNARVTESLYTYEEGERVNDVPRDQASAWGVKAFQVGPDAVLRLGAGIRYIGSTRSTGATTAITTPSYTLVDALVSVDWDRWTASINASNLFDKSYFTACRTFGDCFSGNRRYVVGSLGYRF